MREGDRFTWAGYLLGFSLGGFFDGILLHQILQWHHLLSALEGPRFADLRNQILADGLFHLLMYVVAITGLWLLWRGRRATALPGSGRMLIASALIGFGAWHVVDGIVSHWLLGIHRIRMDTNYPLAWDLAWFFGFGVLLIAIGWRLRSKAPSGGGSSGPRPGIAAAVLGLAVLVTGPIAALPPAGSHVVTVLFKPGVSATAAYSAIIRRNGGILWNDREGTLFVVQFADPAQARSLYGSEALLVSSAFIAAGCASWLRPDGR